MNAAVAMAAWLWAGSPPALLADDSGGTGVRWSSVALSPVAGSARLRRLDVVSPAVLRVEGLPEGCEPRLARRFSSPGGHADVSLPLARDGGRRVAIVPPALRAPDSLGDAAARGSQRGDAPVTFTLEVPDACAGAASRAGVYSATRAEDDLEGPLRVAAAISRAPSVASDDEAVAAAAMPLAHRWQVTLAWASVVERLLARLPGTDGAAPALRRALAARALREAPWPDVQYHWHDRLDLGGPRHDVVGDSAEFGEMGPGAPVVRPVGTAEAVHLRVRLPVDAEELGPVATRLELRFDERRPVILPLVGGRDPEADGVTRARTLVVPVPAGSKTFRVTTIDRRMLVAAQLFRRKRHLEDLFRGRATDRGAPNDRRSIVADALARAISGERGAFDEAARSAPTRGALAAWIALERFEADLRPTDSVATLDRISDVLGTPSDALEKAAVALVSAQLQEARAALDLSEGHPLAAVRGLLSLATRFALTDEAASVLVDAQAFVSDDVTVGGRALAVVEGLLGGRPLDGALMATYGRAFFLVGHWRRLPAVDPLREVPLLDVADGPPSDGHRSRFSVVPAAGLDVDVPAPVTSGRLPVLTLLARPAVPPDVRVVTVDGLHVASLPTSQVTETFDLPVRAGRHRVVISPSSGATLTNFAGGSPSAAILRKYEEVGESPVTVPMIEQGVPAIVEVSLRAATRGTAPAAAGGSLALDLGGKVLSLPFELSAVFDDTAHVGDGWRVSQAVAAIVPLPPEARTLRIRATRPAGSRLFVHVAARSRRALVETTSSDGAADGGPRLGRARALAGSDEPLLAREELLGVLEDPSATPAEIAAAGALWRALDEGPLPVAGTSRAEVASPLLCLVPQDRAPAAAEAAAALAELRAVRTAEAAGELGRVADLWLGLSQARPACSSLHRQAAVARLAADGDARGVLRAHAELVEALNLAPGDAVAARALRRLRARLRPRPIPFADSSAGSYLVETPRFEPEEGTQNAVVSWPRDDRRAGVVGKERSLSLTFSLARPSRVALRVAPLELRARTAEALSPPPLTVVWSRDGQPEERLVCASAKECATPPFALGLGGHLITARVEGGVRPLARVWLDDLGPRTPALRRAGFDSPAATPLAERVLAEHLVATPAAPIRLAIRGPVVLRVELRRRIDAAAAVAMITARVSDAGGESLARRVELAPALDAEARGPDVGAVSLPTVVELPLPQAAPYRVEVSGSGRAVLARFAAWEVAPDADLAPSPPFAFVTHQPPPLVAPLGLRAPETVEVHDGHVSLDGERIGSYGLWTAATRSSIDPEGVPVQTVSALHLGATYRQLVEALHTTAKGEAVQRFNENGAPSQALSATLFFVHPEHRFLRFGLDGDLRTQPIDGVRAWTKRVSFLVEPVVTLAPGLHLVSKIETWWSARSVSSVSLVALRGVDPEVFSPYAVTHPRALAWEEGLEAEPFLNVVLYGDVRATTNPSFRPTDVDHLSTSVFVRALFGRFYAEVLARTTWFLADATRAASAHHTWAGTRCFHTLWPNERNRIEVGAVAGYDFGAHAPELSLSLVWEGSNGRRFRDHSPREGEDFFFPERGPGFGTSQLSVTP
jgi:hypothetical protein